ncbi:MAG TPA: hypothetical protein VFS43_22560 [Polyangiaceae bacterium]|nr:hypothetical protein [Polyangiaceae bacterium]
MYTILNRVGRLIEITIRSPVSLDEAVRWQRDHDAAVAKVAGPYVCFVDVVDATVFPPEVADAYVATMRNEPRLLRTGILLNEDHVLSLQVQRMIREGNAPTRRTFRAARELETWLGEVLTPAERARLDQRLGERGLKSGPA